MARTHPSRSEIDLAITDAADAYGWLHHRARIRGLTRDGYPDGFPPHVLLRDGRLVLVTIAGHGRVLTANERPWVERLSASPAVEMLVIARADLGELASTLAGDATTSTARRSAGDRR